MIQDITLGQYMPGNSFVHRLDPRTKIFLLILYIVTIFRTDKLFALFMLCLVVFLTLKLSRFTFSFVLRGVKIFFWLFTFTAIFHLFFTAGDSIYPFPVLGVNMTYQGLNSGIVVFVQLFLVIMIANSFTLTTSPAEFRQGVERMLTPLKKIGVNPEEVALMISLVIRFIPILKGEAIKILNAQKVRGVDFSQGHIGRRAKNMISIIGPLFVNLLIRTDNIVYAMLSRGVGQCSKRGNLKLLSFNGGDVASIIVMSLFSSFMFLKY